MYLIRLFSAAFLLSSLFALAQENSTPVSRPFTSPKIEFKAPAPNPDQPWETIPRHGGSSSEEALLDGRSVLTLDPHERATRHITVLTGPDDDVCYTMRTYVVARDSKDSDSTHPVRSMTCVPGSRLRLKTADAPANLNQR